MQLAEKFRSWVKPLHFFNSRFQKKKLIQISNLPGEFNVWIDFLWRSLPDPIMFLYFKLSSSAFLLHILKKKIRYISGIREHYFHDPGQNIFVVQPHKDAGESCAITRLPWAMDNGCLIPFGISWVCIKPDKGATWIPFAGSKVWTLFLGARNRRVVKFVW